MIDLMLVSFGVLAVSGVLSFKGVKADTLPQKLIGVCFIVVSVVFAAAWSGIFSA